MRLDTMDAQVDDASVLADCDGLRATLYAGARAGGVRFIGEAFHVFPNGGVTGVLLLAQSHLSIHTWPELASANVDSCRCRACGARWDEELGSGEFRGRSERQSAVLPRSP